MPTSADGQVLLRVATAPAGGVTRVRYCWSESPVCTLYDESGLPAGPFQLDVVQYRLQEIHEQSRL